MVLKKTISGFSAKLKAVMKNHSLQTLKNRVVLYLIQKSRQEWSHKVLFAAASWIKLLHTLRRFLFAGTLQNV